MLFLVHVEVFKLPGEEEYLVHLSDTSGFRQKSHRPGLNMPWTCSWLYLSKPGSVEQKPGSLRWHTVNDESKLVSALVWVSFLLGVLQRLSPACPVPFVERGTASPLPPSPRQPAGVSSYWWGAMALGETTRGGGF